MKQQLTLANYFKEWMETYKKPAILPVTYIKYQNTHRHILHYFGEVYLSDLTRQAYQQGINQFALTHAKRTTAGFHKQIRAAILDALEEGMIENDFTRKAIITGREKVREKVKFHSYSEWKTLIQYTSEHADNHLNLIIYLSGITGLRYAEVLGLTVADINFKERRISVNKTWDHKYHTGFKTTKNDSSVRIVDVDARSIKLIREILHLKRYKHADQKICEDHQGNLPVSATINRYLEKLCRQLGISPISYHGLRHTHASILLFKGINILSVSKRLGHKDVTTTQTVYLHVIKEMEERETKLIMRILNEALKV